MQSSNKYFFGNLRSKVHYRSVHRQRFCYWFEVQQVLKVSAVSMGSDFATGSE